MNTEFFQNVIRILTRKATEFNYYVRYNFRYLTVKRESTAKKSIWLSGIAITVILSVVAYAGLVIYAHYVNCDPIKSGLVSTKDQLLPLFVMDLMSDLPGKAVEGLGTI